MCTFRNAVLFTRGVRNDEAGEAIASPLLGTITGHYHAAQHISVLLINNRLCHMYNLYQTVSRKRFVSI